MFSHCIFCNNSLGNNEVIEEFPVGKRLAFDSAHGRLWVVCARCNRWNLSPLEERWEAIESCERLYRDTPTRLSTENIGLARLSEGLQLVRIGKPQRPEFAAWRYGRALKRRRITAHVLPATALLAGVGYLFFMKSTALMLGGAGGVLWHLPNWISTYRDTLQVRVRLPAPDGEKYTIRAKHALRLELRSEGIGGWVLRLPHTRGTAEFRADAGLRAAAMVLPHYNRYGASENQVQDAVKELGATTSADQFFAQAATRLHRGAPFYERASKVTQHLMLGLEMISHEDQERRALEGELHELEAMWREAEEVAAISDNLLLPSAIAERFRKKTTE